MDRMIVFTEDKEFARRILKIFSGADVKVTADGGKLPGAGADPGTEIIILDLETGFSPLGRVGAPGFSRPCLALSNLPAYPEAVRLIRIGVRGYGNKYMRRDNFCQAVDTVASGQLWLIPSILNRFIQHMAVPAGAEGPASDNAVRDFWRQVSKREREVALEIAKGLSNQEIADAMFVSLRTVKAHLTNIYAKTGCRDRMELALKVNQLR